MTKHVSSDLCATHRSKRSLSHYYRKRGEQKYVISCNKNNEMSITIQSIYLPIPIYFV